MRSHDNSLPQPGLSPHASMTMQAPGCTTPPISIPELLWLSSLAATGVLDGFQYIMHVGISLSPLWSFLVVF